MQYLKAPMVGDPVYGMRGIIPIRLMTTELRAVLDRFKRQALHAVKLGLIHPHTNQPMEWHIELANDMRELLEAMRMVEVPDEEISMPYDFNVDENGMYIGDDDEDWDDDFDGEDELEDE